MPAGCPRRPTHEFTGVNVEPDRNLRSSSFSPETRRPLDAELRSSGTSEASLTHLGRAHGPPGRKLLRARVYRVNERRDARSGVFLESI